MGSDLPALCVKLLSDNYEDLFEIITLYLHSPNENDNLMASMAIYALMLHEWKYDIPTSEN